MGLLIAVAILLQPPHTDLGRAIEYVESRGHTMAVSPVGARGLWQVMPQWSSVHPLLLHVPAIGRQEGKRILRRWTRRCRGDVRCALRAYACGAKGLRGSCEWYAEAVMARVEVR